MPYLYSSFMYSRRAHAQPGLDLRTRITVLGVVRHLTGEMGANFDVWLTVHRNSVWIRETQLDVTFCILYFSSNICSTCFGQPCARRQELATA